MYGVFQILNAKFSYFAKNASNLLIFGPETSNFGMFAHNIEIKRYWDKGYFFLQNIVVTFQNIFKLQAYFLSQTELSKNKYFQFPQEKYWMKISFLIYVIAISYYLIMAILYDKMYRVTWA